MSEETKDRDKDNANRRRYLETIADIKKHQDAKKVEEELAREYERESQR